MHLYDQIIPVEHGRYKCVEHYKLYSIENNYVYRHKISIKSVEERMEHIKVRNWTVFTIIRLKRWVVYISHFLISSFSKVTSFDGDWIREWHFSRTIPLLGEVKYILKYCQFSATEDNEFFTQHSSINAWCYRMYSLAHCWQRISVIASCLQ